ncbi:MAG TPA: hypothetical protein VMB80_02125 [Candidatus Acidoferrum sp.]|nr:hypothetical protein [Candidatus Acidoferrum sp.]
MRFTSGHDRISFGRAFAEEAFPPPGPLTRAVWGSFLLQFVIAAAVFRVMGYYRLMDPDEGHFLGAIRNVYNGLVPCQDFFFQQMPLFPYPYAAAMKIFGYGYEPCIWVSVLCGAGLAVVTSAWFVRYGGGVVAGWVGWCLVLLNAQILFWTPTVKNHAMPVFFGMLALYAASRRGASRSSAFWWAALAGFAAMWAVGTRLLALPFTLLAGGWILMRVVTQPRAVGVWQGLAGFALGLLPPGCLLLRSVLPDPWVFGFDVVGFHAIRSGDLGTFGTWKSVSWILTEMFYQGQFPALLAVALIAGVGGIVLHFRKTSRSPVPPEKSAAAPADRSPELVPAWLTLFGLGAAILGLLPEKTFHQYFMVPLLFFILAGLPGWCVLLRLRKPAGIFGAVLLLAAYGGTPWHGSIELFNHREWVYPRFPREYGVPSVRELSQVLAEMTQPDDPIFTTWQGFTFFANRRDLPGNENFNARLIASQLSENQLRRLHVASNEELTAAIRHGEPKVVVLGFFVSHYRDILYEWNPAVGEYTLRPEFLQQYRLIGHIGYHQIWLRQQP